MGNFIGVVLLLVIIGLIMKGKPAPENEVLDTTDLLATAVALTNSLRTIQTLVLELDLSVDQRLELKKAILDIELERDKVLKRLRNAGVAELTIQQVVGVLK